MSANNTENMNNGADEIKSEEGSNLENNTETSTPEEVVEEISKEIPITKAEKEVETSPEEIESEEVIMEIEPTPEVHTPKLIIEQVATEKEAETETAEVSLKSHQDIEGIEDEDEDFNQEDLDFTSFDKKEYLSLAERMLDAIKKSNIKSSDVKNIDAVTKDLKSAYDELIESEKEIALKEYIAQNGSEDGFEFKNEKVSIRFESIVIQIKEERNKFYRNQDALREDYFERKTNLLQQLREVVEEEEKGGSKENWESFKKIQHDWKDAGNVPSPHNGSLWSAYNALLDRYFDIRSIQNELKELDRKKNLETRTALVEKIEEIAASLKNEELSNNKLAKANDLLNDYKHTGPGPRAEQEALWERLKAAFDIIYDKKRAQGEEMQGIMEEIHDAKASLIDKLKPYLEFNSTSINEWNEKTKEVQAIQEQWNALKGPMPRDKAKTTSKEFWGSLKTFFKNKSAFFDGLEKEREGNLAAKQALLDEVKALIDAGDTSADSTNKVIELQKKWRTIGHVPKKYKDSIYKQFKKTCDAFFDVKREANKEQIDEYKTNLAKKEELCAKIEKEIADKSIDLSKLPDYKKAYNEIGFVPRSDMNKIQKRFIDAINNYVKASSKIEGHEQEKLLLKNEVEVSLKSGGDPRAMQRQESDLRRKLKSLEDDVNQLKTNIEFFGRSKNADKLKAEYEKKIQKSESEADKIKEKLKLISAAY